jgi:transposase
MPLNRQVQMLARQGVALDRSTLAKWIKRMAWWLSGLYRRQRKSGWKGKGDAQMRVIVSIP